MVLIAIVAIGTEMTETGRKEDTDTPPEAFMAVSRILTPCQNLKLINPPMFLASVFLIISILVAVLMSMVTQALNIVAMFRNLAK